MLIMRKSDCVRTDFLDDLHIFFVHLIAQCISCSGTILMTADTTQWIYASI